ncbi:IclR family transcriptional regulator [Candidatus Thioglobus sp.]|nr:IclR family transcriptional regulator [Candidatus Thioglobus sp.]
MKDLENKLQNKSSIISKSMSIVDILASSSRPMNFSEILSESGLAKSSTHRLLSILQYEGLIYYDQSYKTYGLGNRLREWARKSWINSDLQRESSDELEKLCESCGHNVCLMGMAGYQVIILSAIHPYQVPYAAKMGEHAMVHCTAGGKVLTAFMSKKQQDELIDKLTFEQFTLKTITDREVFKAQLKDVKRDSLALCEGEEFMQTSAIGAPIFNHHGEVVAALCIWGVTERMKPHHVRDWADELKASTHRISENLGWVFD